jgi:hypothetical protein
MTMNHYLFKIEAVGRDPSGAPAYHGTGLHGQAVATAFPIEILREEDEEWINEMATS